MSVIANQDICLRESLMFSALRAKMKYLHSWDLRAPWARNGDNPNQRLYLKPTDTYGPI